MDLISPWRTPHHFSVIPIENDHPALELRPVFTYVLAVAELGEADLADGLPAEAVSRIGYEWLASLADRLQKPAVSALTTFLHDDVGIAKPGQESNRAPLGLQPSTGIPVVQLAQFTQSELARIREFVQFEIRPFLPELIRAAEGQCAPDPAAVEHEEGDGLAVARRLLTIYGPQLDPTRLQAPGDDRTLWGLTFTNLAERIAFELFEIFATRPLLRRCRYCHRIFVPRTSTESKCRADLWVRGQASALELCIPQPAVDAHNAHVVATQHERERKRRHQAMQREIKRSATDSRRAEKARVKYEQWIGEHGKPRGPQPRPLPDVTSAKT